MSDQMIQERIIQALGKGKMTSDELTKEMGIPWTHFSTQLLSMRRNLLNPEGPIITTKDEESDKYYYQLHIAAP